MDDEERPFFDRERERLAVEIASGFEILLSSVNVLNRKVEEVLGMTKEYETIASLWGSFHQLMRRQGERSTDGDSFRYDAPQSGLPGTGGYVLSTTKQ